MSLSPMDTFQSYLITQQHLVDHLLFPEVFPSVGMHDNKAFQFLLISQVTLPLKLLMFFRIQ